MKEQAAPGHRGCKIVIFGEQLGGLNPGQQVLKPESETDSWLTLTAEWLTGKWEQDGDKSAASNDVSSRWDLNKATQTNFQSSKTAHSPTWYDCDPTNLRYIKIWI